MATFPSKAVSLLLAGGYAVAPSLVMAGEDALAKIESDHGFSLAISGMVIVFGGLLAISGFIGLLPKVLARLQKPPVPRPVPHPGPGPESGLDPATQAAIAIVLHAEAERAAGQGLKVTLPLTSSPWALSSQMRVLPGRLSS